MGDKKDKKGQKSTTEILKESRSVLYGDSEINQTSILSLRNPIVCSGLFLEQTQAYIYIRLIASGIDKIHNCPKCRKEKHFQNLMHMSETQYG
jgi:hypothetical protein